MLLIYGLPSPILVDHAVMHIGYKLFAIWSLRRPTIHKMLTLIAVKNESLYTLPYSANINYFVIYIIIIIMAIIIQIFHANTHSHTFIHWWSSNDRALRIACSEYQFIWQPNEQ